MKSHRQLHKYCMQVRSRQTCILLWSHSNRTQLWRYFAGNSKIPIRSIRFIAKIIPRLTLFWIPFEFLRTSYITKSKYQGYLVSLNQHSLRSTEIHPLPSSDFEQVFTKAKPLQRYLGFWLVVPGPRVCPPARGWAAGAHGHRNDRAAAVFPSRWPCVGRATPAWGSCRRLRARAWPTPLPPPAGTSRRKKLVSSQAPALHSSGQSLEKYREAWQVKYLWGYHPSMASFHLVLTRN